MYTFYHILGVQGNMRSSHSKAKSECMKKQGTMWLKITKMVDGLL